MFSSRSLIVYGLTFRHLFHPEFIFVYFLREWSSFILLHVAVLFSQHHLLRRLSFHHFIFLLVSIFDVEILSLSLLIICFKLVNTFSLRFLIFVLITMMCLGVHFFIFILFGSLWVFWIHGIFHSGRSLAVISSKLSQPHTPFPPLLGLQWNVC